MALRKVGVAKFVVAVLFAGRATAGQVMAPAPSGAAGAAAAVQRALAAHGPKWAAGGVTDWVAEGKITYFSAEGAQATFDVTVTRKGTSQVQRVVKQPAGEVRVGSDGGRNWDSLGGLFTVKAQGRALQFIESQTTRSVQRLLNYKTEGLMLRDHGQIGKSRVIEAEDSGGKKTSYFIDDGTNAVTRVEFVTGEAKDPFSGRFVPTTDSYVLSDYRTVETVLMPFKVERYVNGIKAEEMQFTSVRYNASVKDDAFKP